MTESFDDKRSRWLQDALTKHTVEVNTDRVGRRHARVMAELARQEELANARRVEERRLEAIASGLANANEATAHAARVRLIYERLRRKVLAAELTPNEAMNLFTTLSRKP